MNKLIDQYWMKSEGAATRFGLSAEFVASVQGDWLALELPKPGELIRVRETFGFLTTDRATHDLRAPCAFRVIEVNPKPIENAELARLSPHGEGWLLEIEAIESQAGV